MRLCRLCVCVAGGMLVGNPAYYMRFGFKPVAGLVYRLPPEYFMALAFGNKLLQGAVSYHTAFRATA